ncbi:MAG: hypothetical protein H6869_11525 [Rhodospirillales bacterium]|nr:hypothetical protein [Rhodospirillales bacterium]
MPVFEEVSQTQRRAQISHFPGLPDLESAFCTAAWNAVEMPLEAVIAATGQQHATGVNSIWPSIHVTEPLRRVFQDIVTRAIRDEAKRLDVPFPNHIYEDGNMDLLLSRSLGHERFVAVHLYDSKRP